METIHFNIDIKSIAIKFTCPNCKKQTESKNISVPEFKPTDKTKDSINCDHGCICCDQCSKEYNIDICSDINNSWININGFNQDTSVQIIEK